MTPTSTPPTGDTPLRRFLIDVLDPWVHFIADDDLPAFRAASAEELADCVLTLLEPVQWYWDDLHLRLVDDGEYPDNPEDAPLYRLPHIGGPHGD